MGGLVKVLFFSRICWMRAGSAHTALVGMAWVPDCSLSSGTCSKLGQVARSTGHGPQRTLYGTCGVKSVGATHELEEQSAWGANVSLSPVLVTHHLNSFPRRASQQWSPLEFIAVSWDMSALHRGRCQGAGTPWLWHWSGHTKGSTQLNRQAGIHGELATKKAAQGQNLSISTLPSQRELPVVLRGEESCPCQYCTPLLWRAGLFHRVACVYAVFPWHSPSLRHSVWQPWSAHTMQEHQCHSLLPTLARGIPEPHRCTGLSWSHALVSVWSNCRAGAGWAQNPPQAVGGCISERQGKLSAGII